MRLPVADQALEQVGTAQQRTVGGRRAAERDVVAAAGAGVAAVEHELLGAEPRLARVLVERARAVDQLAPGGRRRDVHLDDAGVRRDRHRLQARVARRRIAFDHHRRAGLGRRVLDRRDERERRLEALDRGQEHVHVAAARFHAQRRVDHLARLVAADLALLLPLRRGQRAARLERIDRRLAVGFFRQHPGQRRERQAEADRRIAADQHEPSALERPGRGFPAHAVGDDGLERQHVAGFASGTGAQQPRESRALVRLRQVGLPRIDVDRQRRVLLEQRRDVLVGGERRVGRQAQATGDRRGDARSVLDARASPARWDRRAARRRATPARRPRARRARSPSAAAVRPGTTCPARRARVRAARSAPSACARVSAPARAWPATAPRCSTPGRPCRRSTRRSARRPA